MQKLLDVMRQLRAPDGCPWDKEQTHQSLRPYLLEEAAEATDAIAENNPDAMRDELGDVLLQIAFHAVIAEEDKRFNYDSIETSIVNKLIRRHPHVFADTTADTPEEVLKNWEQIKATEETKPRTPAEKVPRSLPALMRAYELGKKLEWAAGSKESVQQAAGALEATNESVAALLLAVVDFARAHQLNPEFALRDAANARVEVAASGDD